MKILTYLITIFLVFGLLGVPGSVFAQESSSTISESTLQHSDPMILENMVPLLKGGGHFSSHASKKVHGSDGDDTSDTGNNSTDDSDDGSGWWITLIIILIIIAIVVLAVWYFRK